MWRTGIKYRCAQLGARRMYHVYLVMHGKVCEVLDCRATKERVEEEWRRLHLESSLEQGLERKRNIGTPIHTDDE